MGSAGHAGGDDLHAQPAAARLHLVCVRHLAAPVPDGRAGRDPRGPRTRRPRRQSLSRTRQAHPEQCGAGRQGGEDRGTARLQRRDAGRRAPDARAWRACPSGNQGCRVTLMLTRRNLLLGLAVAAAPALADDYPNRIIRMIVPFGAGGPTDVFTRVLGEELRKSLGQSLVMENRPGAGTIIGTSEAAKSAPDGYTLLMISATQTTVETLNPNKPYI